QWVQYDINRCSIFQEWHILITNDTCNDTFVTVTSRHLIPYFQLTFLSNINFSHLNDTRWKFITYRDCKLITFESTQFFVNFNVIEVKRQLDQFVFLFISSPSSWVNVCIIQIHKDFLCEFSSFRY